MGGVVTDTNCQRASQSLYETIAVSLSARLPPCALLAASPLARDSCSATFSPQIFEQKRDSSQSSSPHDRDFRKRNSHFRGFPEDVRTLPKMSEDVPTTLLNSPDSNGLQTFERFAFVIKSKERVVIQSQHEAT